MSLTKVAQERWSPGTRIDHRRRINRALLLIAAGRGSASFDGGPQIPLARGSLCLLAPEVPHVVAADPGAHLQLIRAAGEGPRLASLLDRHCGTRSGVLQLGAAPEVAAAAEALVGAARAGGPLCRDCCLRHLELLLLHVHRRLIELGRAPDAGQALAQRALAWLRAHLHRRVTLRECAAAIGASPEHLSRVVRAATGAPPSALLRQLRTGVARELLSETSLPLSAVAERLGYADAFAFSKAYKRWTGEAPSALRRPLRDGAEPLS